MKKGFLFVMVGIGILGALALSRTDQPLSVNNDVNQVADGQSQITAAGNSVELTFNGVQYRIISSEVPATYRLTLIPNFTAKESGLALVKKYGCDQAINGGFYTKDDKPLGLFLSGNERYGTPIQSNLITGYFYQDKSGERFISQIAPNNLSHLDIVLQTGPLYPVTARKFSIVDDKPARRSLLVTDTKGKLSMVSVVSADNINSGPYLGDLPSLFADDKVQRELGAAVLLNLDGGAASFYFTKDGTNEFLLSEITPIGSLFCAQRSNLP